MQLDNFNIILILVNYFPKIFNVYGNYISSGYMYFLKDEMQLRDGKDLILSFFPTFYAYSVIKTGLSIK